MAVGLFQGEPVSESAGSDSERSVFTAIRRVGSAKIPTTVCLIFPSRPTRKEVGRVEASKLVSPGCQAMATG